MIFGPCPDLPNEAAHIQTNYGSLSPTYRRSQHANMNFQLQSAWSKILCQCQTLSVKNDSESQWWKKMYMTFWQAKSTLLATLTFSLVYFLNGRKPDKGNRKLALDIREQSQHQWVWTTAENFIIGNLGRCLLPPSRQATISHVLPHFTEKR